MGLEADNGTSDISEELLNGAQAQNEGKQDVTADTSKLQRQENGKFAYFKSLVQQDKLSVLEKELPAKFLHLRHDFGESLLHFSCKIAQFEASKMLIRLGADLGCENDQGLRPSEVTCDRKIQKFMRLAERYRLVLKPPLSMACCMGDLQMVKLLCKKEAALDCQDAMGNSPLHEAAANGNHKIIELLISSGADVNCLNEDGLSPVYLAALYSLEGTVRLLMKHGAKPAIAGKRIRNLIKKSILAIIENDQNTASMEYVSPVSNISTKKQSSPDSAKKRSSPDSTKIIESSPRSVKKDSKAIQLKLDPFYREKSTGRTQLHKYSAKGDIEAVQGLVNLKAEVNVKDNAGYTPLHEASLAGHVDVVNLLLSRSASVNAKAINDDTPLHDAAEANHFEVVRALLDAGADASIMNHSGKTALMVTEDENIKRLLTAKISSISSQKASENIPFEEFVPEESKKKIRRCIDTGDVASLRKLLKSSIYLDFKSEKGLTPLHEAVSKGNVDILEILLENGASVNSFSSAGNTPLHVACSCNNYVAVETLLKFGADPKLKDEFGNPPEILASEKFIFKLLKETRPSGTRVFQNYNKRREYEEIYKAKMSKKENVNSVKKKKKDNAAAMKKRKITKSDASSDCQMAFEKTDYSILSHKSPKELNVILVNGVKHLFLKEVEAQSRDTNSFDCSKISCQFLVNNENITKADKKEIKKKLPVALKLLDQPTLDLVPLEWADAGIAANAEYSIEKILDFSNFVVDPRNDERRVSGPLKLTMKMHNRIVH